MLEVLPSKVMCQNEQKLNKKHFEQQQKNRDENLTRSLH